MILQTLLEYFLVLLKEWSTLLEWILFLFLLRLLLVLLLLLRLLLVLFLLFRLLGRLSFGFRRCTGRCRWLRFV